MKVTEGVEKCVFQRKRGAVEDQITVEGEYICEVHTGANWELFGGQGWCVAWACLWSWRRCEGFYNHVSLLCFVLKGNLSSVNTSNALFSFIRSRRTMVKKPGGTERIVVTFSALLLPGKALFLLHTFLFCFKCRAASLKSTNDLIPDELALLTVQQRGRTFATLDFKAQKNRRSEESLCAVNEADSICDKGELKAPREH